jgi:predicted DNA-binding transcriptional regulator AlpA
MPTAAYSIAEFCRAHRVSRAFFYVLLKRGDAPKIMRIGKRRLVSDEAARDWRQRMERAAAEQDQPETGERK